MELRTNKIKGREGETHNLIFPFDVMCEILSSLPIKTILCCMVTCKTWYDIIRHPDFSKLHLKKSPACVLEYHKGQLCMLEFEKCLDTYALKTFKLNTQKYMPMHRGYCRFSWIGSCNSLLCFCNKEDNTFCICNPFTCEYVSFPMPKLETKFRWWPMMSGFCFCEETNQYQVIMFTEEIIPITNEDLIPSFLRQDLFYWDICFSKKSKDIFCQVHTLGTAEWRAVRISDYYPNRSNRSERLIYLNGALHWIVDELSEGGPGIIYSFRIGNEEIQPIPSPSSLHSLKYTSLCLLDDCLVLLDCKRSSTEIWVMKNYGVKESWTKTWVINDDFPHAFKCKYLSTLKVLEDGEILMFGIQDLIGLKYGLGCYCPESKTSKRLINAVEGFFLIPFVPSLISPKDVILGQN